MQFYELGFDPLFEVSAEARHRRRRICSTTSAAGWPRAGKRPAEPSADAPPPEILEEIAVTIVGRPQRGKVLPRESSAARGAE